MPGGDRPLKGGFAAACGDALRAPLTGRSPPGLGSACGLSRIRRVPRLIRLKRKGLRLKANPWTDRACVVSLKEDHSSFL